MAATSTDDAAAPVTAAEQASTATAAALAAATATLEWAEGVGASSSTSSSGTMLRPFKPERYFADYEFSAPHLLCCSDAEALSMKEVLQMNSENGQAGKELAERWESLSLGYTESRGDPLLLAEVSKLYGDAVSAEGPTAPVVMAPQEGMSEGPLRSLTCSARQDGQWAGN